MKIIFLVIVLTVFAKAQIPLWGASAVAGFTGGYSDGLRFMDRYQLHNRSHETEWHNYQFISRVATVGIGISLYGYSDNFGDGVKKGMLSAAIFWTLYDIGVNLGQKFPVFRVSKVSGSFLEPLSSIWFKLAFLSVAILINIIL